MSSNEIALPTTGPSRQWITAMFFKYAMIGGVDACWLWSGTRIYGYGYFNKQHLKGEKRNRTFRAHRVAYEIAHRVVLKPTEYVHHECRERACVNPRHLSLTTPSDHMADHHLPTHCKNGHEFTEENTRLRFQDGHPHRQCKICRRSWERDHSKKRYATDPVYRQNLLERQRRDRERKAGRG